MSSKKVVYELSVEELIKLAGGSVPVEMDKITEAAKFAYDLNIRHGDARIPAQLIYYTYKQWRGWENKFQPKPQFFKDFSKQFESVRTNEGIHYLLDPKPFDLSQETYFLVRKDVRDSRAKRKRSQKT